MKLLATALLALSALAAEAPKPVTPTKEEALSKRIVELEKQNAISDTRALRAKWELFHAEAIRLDAEWKKAALRACELHGIPANDCRWENDTVARVMPTAPAPAKPEAAKSAPAAKAK